jgi:hypothetical protein
MSTPRPRWGVRFTDVISKNKDYIQNLYDNDSTAAKRGELFLNEVSEELFYVGLDGVCRGVNETTPVSFSRIDFTGLREFADDAAAAAADPALDIGGLYRTGSVLKIRVA